MKNLYRKTLALLLALMICLGACPAFADDRTTDSYYYGGTGQDTVYEATPLPDGNLLLNGYTQLGRAGQAQLTGKGHPTRAWLLCLAPDGSILWEVIDLLAETFEVPWKTREESARETSKSPGTQRPLASS